MFLKWDAMTSFTSKFYTLMLIGMLLAGCGFAPSGNSGSSAKTGAQTGSSSVTASQQDGQQDEADEGCSLPNDQLRSLEKGRRSYPLQILIDDRLDAEEIVDVWTAAQKWNEVSPDQPFFEVEQGPIPFQVRQQPKSCHNVPPYVYIFRSGKEDLDIPGFTLSCQAQMGWNLHSIQIESNRQQFLSVVLHEMGHALGLGHSCAQGAVVGKDYRDCKTLVRNHPYFKAVMYPAIPENEVRENLQKNDRQRARCLMSDL